MPENSEITRTELEQLNKQVQNLNAKMKEMKEENFKLTAEVKYLREFILNEDESDGNYLNLSTSNKGLLGINDTVGNQRRKAYVDALDKAVFVPPSFNNVYSFLQFYKNLKISMESSGFKDDFDLFEVGNLKDQKDSAKLILREYLCGPFYNKVNVESKIAISSASIHDKTHVNGFVILNSLWEKIIKPRSVRYDPTAALDGIYFGKNFDNTEYLDIAIIDMKLLEMVHNKKLVFTDKEIIKKLMTNMESTTKSEFHKWLEEKKEFKKEIVDMYEGFNTIDELLKLLKEWTKYKYLSKSFNENVYAPQSSRLCYITNKRSDDGSKQNQTQQQHNSTKNTKALKVQVQSSTKKMNTIQASNLTARLRR